MNNRLLAVSLLFVGSSGICQTGDAGMSASRFDGEWIVAVSCADTQDRRGLVKGYDWTFRATIADGKLQGQYGEKGAPSSAVFTGTVAADGTLEVRAVGHTGNAEYSVGSAARGTPFGYTMTGRLDGSRGEAVRRELRPCKAMLSRM